MEATAKFQLGSVISGTLKTEDLLKAFAEELRYRICSLNPKPSRTNGSNTVGHQLLIKAFIFLEDVHKWVITSQPAGVYIKHEYQELARQLVDGLRDELNALCPPFVYFGTRPDDGSDPSTQQGACFGFWPDHDSLSDAIYEASKDDDNMVEWGTHGVCEVYLPDHNLYVVISDHGNVTVYNQGRNELWSCA